MNILFLVFNRPDTAAKVFERIRKARPQRLFVAADGPRASKEGEAELCAQTRAIIDGVDWDCEVHKLFREENLGCRRAVSGAITWFFEHVEEGIILEDDCEPDKTFFPFCQEMLAHYRDDDRVFCVGGNNPIERPEDESYYFSTYPFIWGWATWKRAWTYYDSRDEIEIELDHQWLSAHFGSEEIASYWEMLFDWSISGKVDSWGFRWLLTQLKNGGLCAVSSRNLVTNIGFDERATHTMVDVNDEGNRALVPAEFPLKHPPSVRRNYQADDELADVKFAIPRSDQRMKKAGVRLDQVREKAKERLRKIPPRRLTGKIAKII
ncbi:MAG: hypothetical protein Q7Q71_00780 [Verrucomicrobiota bacterium JB023]|nr:hypothetical protein [Verrucomicrobiota bacterium JB023]